MWQTSGRSARFAHQIVHRAFLRTFWQAVAGTPTVAGHRSVDLTASDLITIDWAGVALGIAAVILSGVLSEGRATGDILANGLSANHDAATPTTRADRQNQ